MNERGQTANDYLIGIIIVLVTITAAFGFFPDLYEPFDEAVTDDQETMAENLASQLVSDYRVMGEQQTLNYSGFRNAENNIDGIQSAAGIQDWRNWNVTLSNGTDTFAFGTSEYGPNGEYDGPAATAIRYVQMRGSSGPSGNTNPDCSDGCLLIVRVW